MRRWVVLLGAALIISGCVAPGVAQPAPDGTSVHTLTVGGLQRSYRVYRPAGLPAAAPLVVMLHGGFGSAANAERRYGWDELADTAKFVVAYPDGVSRAWNTGGNCCGRAAAEGVDDVGFIAAVVGDVGRAVAIDPARVYVTGMSNGGIMAYTLACATGLFAAIGPVAATQLGPCPSPHPTSVLHIHGAADPNIRYDGGPGAGVAQIDGPSVPEVDAFWRTVDDCAPPVSTTDGAVTSAIADCPSGRSVQLTTIAGGGHQWPDSATATLWQFFTAHPR
ncbi:polyhydroxybutyrate depolymerase [Mycolicibacter heraklionensis]|uniref:Polyhydroxybutyrate depolymerase n=1 Tax=Mycolicibacter heraklionensis TaxID=512402 RepID=A0ABR5FLP7_9MYCO|nr:PHB depolymerase family esterase [Mycolicibacter heraklionensis]KLO31829.1 polyhydroxybutyrate depolymerase [Mycolicibacter heraklionensis]